MMFRGSTFRESEMSGSRKSTRNVVETEEVRATVSSSPEVLRTIGGDSVRRRRSASLGVNGGHVRLRRGGAQKTAPTTIQYFLVVGHLMFAGVAQCSGVGNSERLMRSLLLNPYYLNPTAAFYDRAQTVTDQLLGGGERYYLDADGQPRVVSEDDGDVNEARRGGAKVIVVARHVDGGSGLAAGGSDAEPSTTKISLTELLAAAATSGGGDKRRLPYRSTLFRHRRSVGGGVAVAPALGPRRQRRRDSFLLAIPFSDYTPTPCRWKLCASMFTPSTTAAMFK